jgi:hypothetical protein
MCIVLGISALTSYCKIPVVKEDKEGIFPNVPAAKLKIHFPVSSHFVLCG